MEQALVEIKGGDTIQSALGRLANALENPKELWDAIGFEMAEDTRLRISDGEDINGQPFTPSIRVQQNGGTTLNDKGYLKNAISHFADNAGVTWGVTHGPTDPYARIHNFGGTIVPKTKKALRFKVAGKWVMKQKVVMPKRQYLGWTDHDEKTVINMVLEFLQKETQA